MSSDLTIDNIDEKIRSKISVQDYTRQSTIDGVKIAEIKNLTSEDGDFSEVLRFNEGGEVEGFENLKIAQINRTKMYPGMVKAWHLHLRQDEIWYVLPDSRIILGLWDIRKDSQSLNLSMRLAVGGGKSHLVFIPKGVAHGCANFSRKEANIFYFVSEKFDSENPDEQRLPWDSLGKEFWESKRE